MSDMDAFKTSLQANSPTTPDTSNTGTDSDMFGMAVCYSIMFVFIAAFVWLKVLLM